MAGMPEAQDAWPDLPLKSWKDTYETLHMWAQVVGKVRLKLTPFVNHWWQVVFYVTPRGLTTGPIPYEAQSFEIGFDFVNHVLSIDTSEGQNQKIKLESRSVASFYQELMARLMSLGINVQIDPMPKEVPNPIAFQEDDVHRSYNQDSVEVFWKLLSQADRVMKKFRGGFFGKASPVQFYWGSFDLAVTRFSGRRAPERPEADHITKLAYSHEVISCGFWPGGGNIEGPAFYAYAAPEPKGFAEGIVLPASAFYNAPTKNFILMIDEVRKARDPDQMVLDFFQSTYDLAADLGKWDREELDRKSFLQGSNPARAA